MEALQRPCQSGGAYFVQKKKQGVPVMISIPSPPSTTGGLSEIEVAVEQYKAYLQDLGNIGTRQTTANGFYLSIITALLGLLTLMKKDEGLADLQTIFRLAVPAFAIGICLVWRNTIFSYRTIVGVKFTVLREIEVHGGLFRAYKREKELLKAKQCLAAYDALIPLYLALPFVVILGYTLWELVRKLG